MHPQTLYAKSGDFHIAYQVIGKGPVDLVFIPGFLSHVEWWWEEPLAARFFNRLASFSRLILVDKRGTGMSDRVPDSALPTLEERMDDVRAVMDAARSERAALFGSSEGGPMSVLFAATHPERTVALILWSTFPRAVQDEDFPQGWLPAHAVNAYVDGIERAFIDGTFGMKWGFDDLIPAERERARRWFMQMARLAASPGAAVALMRMALDIDVRNVLPSVRVPTLLLARSGDENVPATRYMAEHIAGARYVELPGREHVPIFGDQEPIVQEVEEFLTGARSVPEPDRVLATVLFTDVVDSTKRVAELGDRRWTELLEAHHSVVRKELARYRGREIDTAGDGFLATFDGPARGIRCACAIREAVRDLGIEIRAGLHTGECEVVKDSVRGIAVHIGARVAFLAGPGEVLVSSTVRDLVAGSRLQFEDRGSHHLKGMEGEWPLFAVKADQELQSRS